MAMERQKFFLTQRLKAHQTCHDYTYQQECFSWGAFRWSGIPGTIILIGMGILIPFDDGLIVVWGSSALFVVLASVGFIAFMGYWQRQRKYHAERIAFYQEKIQEGYTYFLIENGQQKFYQ